MSTNLLGPLNTKYHWEKDLGVRLERKEVYTLGSKIRGKYSCTH